MNMLAGAPDVKRVFQFPGRLQLANHNMLLDIESRHLYVDGYFDMLDSHGQNHNQCGRNQHT